MLDYAGEMQQLHVIDRAALFHLVSETIHPLIDSNGHVGRLLLNLELMKEGYPPINIKFSDVSKYYDCFNHYRANDYDASKMTELVSVYETNELRKALFVPKLYHQLSLLSVYITALLGIALQLFLSLLNAR